MTAVRTADGRWQVVAGGDWTKTGRDVQPEAGAPAWAILSAFAVLSLLAGVAAALLSVTCAA